ncbi:MAG TPA: hypothetical protein VKR59_16915 [Terriglobales bacterium]|nr:hypothetical protein [Terriglobales bacterium]
MQRFRRDSQNRPAVSAYPLHRGWLREIQKSYASPAYAELQLAVVPAQIAILRIFGDFAFRDPILITAQGIIIDGYHPAVETRIENTI